MNSEDARAHLISVLRDPTRRDSWNAARQYAEGMILLAKARAEIAWGPFYALDVKGADLARLAINGVNLRRVNLGGASLHKANLRDVDLSGANLEEADLSGASLVGINLGDIWDPDPMGEQAPLADQAVNLKDANLERIDLSRANLRQANLQGAHAHYAQLNEANLSYADLSHSDLTHANLSGANLRSASLVGANLSAANLRHTNFLDADLTDIVVNDATTLGSTALVDVALRSFSRTPVKHEGVSIVDFRSILRAVDEPDLKPLLRSSGMPDVFVEYMVDCARSLTPSEVFSLLQKTFISYGSPDEAFARKLNDALKKRGVFTFFFAEDAIPGDKLHRMMRREVNKNDKVILVCSRESLNRKGLLNELEETLQREARDGGAAYLLPVRLDDYVLGEWAPEREDLAQTVRDRVVADFRDHADPQRFEAAVTRLIGALKT